MPPYPSQVHRIHPLPPRRSELREFTGRFYSPEVDTFYTIVLHEDRLVARHRRSGDLPLTPAEPDGFGSGFPFLSVQFERGQRGQVTGFLVSAGRTIDIRFEKQE